MNSISQPNAHHNTHRTETAARRARAHTHAYHAYHTYHTFGFPLNGHKTPLAKLRAEKIWHIIRGLDVNKRSLASTRLLLLLRPSRSMEALVAYELL